ncbi:hypothetical protein [Cupriavidus basilensis]|uniref:hypothetical protein n=1 Tax=Cupriavidus basilensis TaxID=68895 RepID=UPI0020A6782A|nr:hypothetical protein [Cupriavidus basilensis]MCP3020333.1 hypothetical protein [Cupriavidus basilensis]
MADDSKKKRKRRHTNPPASSKLLMFCIASFVTLLPITDLPQIEIALKLVIGSHVKVSADRG